MARKNIVPFKALNSQSLSTAFTSAISSIQYLDNISYQINVLTSDSMGTFAVEVSNDYHVDLVTNSVSNPGTWVALNLSGVPTVGAANDSITISLNQVPYSAIRLSYTPTTPGTGICDAYMFSKSVGA